MNNKKLNKINRLVDFDIVVYNDDSLKVLKAMDAESVHCCVTSPPYYGLRDYGVDGQIGIEKTPQKYTKKIVKVFREVKRVLRHDGTLWLNLGDSYGGSGKGLYNKHACTDHSTKANYGKSKNLLGIPWIIAFNLQNDGWYLRSDIIWSKPNPMPESVTDRPTKAHEYLFLFSKSEHYYYDNEAIKEKCVKTGSQKHLVGGQNERAGSRKGLIGKAYSDRRNKRTVWTIPVNPFKGAHFATFPEKLIEPCIKAGCPEGGTVLDPFAGSGTSGFVARKYGCKFVGIELNPDYMQIIRERIGSTQGDLFQRVI